MKRKLNNLFALATISLAAIAWGAEADKPVQPAATPATVPAKVAKPRVEVVFVLDSTGSMGGLIEGAKQKIWAIANGIVAQKPTPDVRFGLISYRDKGDDYITKKFDITDDIDLVFKNLQSFQAGGGGDGPESVNQALDEAVNKMAWSPDKSVTKVIFLVGDFPPHMDYQDDVKYPATCQAAAKNNIIINTVQCGTEPSTTPVWQEIAKLAEGSYIALAQSGGMTAVATPYDGEIAKISGEIGRTAVAYGSRERRALVASKMAAAEAAPAAVAADRATFNFSSGGKAIQGHGDLVEDYAQGNVKLDAVKDAELPPEMQKMTAEERKAHLAKQQAARAVLNQQLDNLARQRADFIEKEKKRLVKEGKGDAFDLKVGEIITEQTNRKK